MQRAGEYIRDLGAPLARLIENALDGEHLPHLHATDFASIRMIAADDRGWSAEARLSGGGALTLDLTLDADRLGWVTAARAGDRIVSRIVSRAEATGPGSCRVSVAFYVAGIPPGQEESFAAYYRSLYARLYDEDEAMMIAREAALRGGTTHWTKTRRTILADGHAIELPRACPHWGLPLDAEPDENGIVTCPWHGYRFDARTGRCVSGQACAWTPASGDR
jgi:nitrite reductase/ring-hydroxylating ferredoxin subunit